MANAREVFAEIAAPMSLAQRDHVIHLYSKTRSVKIKSVTRFSHDHQWLKWRGTQGDAVPPPQIYGRMRSPTSGIPTDARGR